MKNSSARSAHKLSQNVACCPADLVTLCYLAILCTGMARAHLAKWVASATVVQRAVRAWLLRRRLQELLQQHRLAAVALQAAWRGRQVRQQQAQLVASCVRIQVSLVWHSLQ